MYLFELFSNINCGASAWLDWNMLLDWKGGPSYCDNNVKSPIILNEQGDDFILTPIYKALKKFAEMFPAGSKVVRCENSSKNVAVIARKTKSGYEAVVANVSKEEREILVKIGEKEQKITLKPAEIDKISF
jgi:glucosylceramidase